MKDSGIEWIGEIPEHWKICRLKQIATINSGEYIPKSEYSECGKYTIVGSNGAIGKTNYFNNEKRVLTTGRVGTIGTVGIAEKCWITDNALIIDTNFNLDYLRYVIQNFDFASMCSGTAQPLITASSLGEQYIPFPDEVTQVKIAGYLDCKCSEIDTLIAAKEKTNALLKERRQSIIYEAVTKGLNPNAPMKPSGVEWIGEIPEDWKLCRIKHLIDANHPYPVGDGDHGLIKAEDYQDEGIPYIRVLNLTWGSGLNLDSLVYISEEMNNRIKNSELKPNDILIAKTGATIGKTAIVPESLPVSNTTSHVGKITLSKEHDSKFFFYVMTSSIVQKQISDLSLMQSTRPELGIDGLKNLIVTLPPLEVQQSISNYLDRCCTEIDTLINTNNSAIQKLKEYRQSVIFEAVTGKIPL